MCFEIFYKYNKNEKNSTNNLFKIMEYYILLSNTFIKPYGIYDDLNLAKKEYEKLTGKCINASLYKVYINNNIVDSKDCYTLISDNKISYW